LKRFGWISLVSAFLAGWANGQSHEYTDPVGYMLYTIPGNSETLLPLQLAKGLALKEFVTEVTPAGIRFATPIPSNAFQSAGSGYMEVRIGTMAGLGIPATSINGNFLNLERSPVGLVSVGDFASVREDMTLGELFQDLGTNPFQTGISAELADNISVWDARSQSSRVFYFHTGLGWREAGKFSEGDKSSTTIRFPSGVIFRRRAPTEALVLVSGSVIMPLNQRFHPIWPGRNIISAPFTNSPTIGSYIRPLLDAPYTVVSSDSAPLSDTMRVYGYDVTGDSGGSISPVIYFSKSQWRAVGSTADAGNTSMSLAPCLDFHRVGPAGYLRFQGVPEVSAASRAPALAAIAEPITEVKPITLKQSAAGITVRWTAQAGLTYQVQTKAIGGTTWTNLQGPLQATSASASFDFTPSAGACIRVIQR
jgi:hypothetical protein